MLSSLKPAAGKFVLGPPVDTEPPVVVFTGPADNPDAVADRRAPVEEEKAAPRPAISGQAAAKPQRAAETAKPKVTSAAQ